MARFTACAIAVLLVAAGGASAHTLSLTTARQAVKTTTRSWFMASDLTERFWVDRCRRVSAHQVNCRSHIQGYNAGLGATETCTKTAIARFVRTRRVRVTLGGSTTCKYDYGEEGGGGPAPIAAPPAPDTTIVSGPAEGSTVPTYAGDAVVTWQFAAVGGEDPIFECSVDGAPFLMCMSPATLGFKGAGPHTLAVRAVSIRLGTVPVPDPTPATRSFVAVA